MGARCCKIAVKNADTPDPILYGNVHDNAQGFQSFQKNQLDPYNVVNVESAVKAAVIVRPLLPTERGCKHIIDVKPPGKVAMPALEDRGPAAGYQFDFDRVYDARDANAPLKLFEELIRSAMDKFFKGVNTTVLAYGQTGSGKTYTMGTMASRKDMKAKQSKQIIPQCISLLFSYMQKERQTYDMQLTISYLEIYKGDDIRDLLQPQPAAAGQRPGSAYAIHEDENGGIIVDGVREMPVSSLADIAAALELGNTQRSVGSTNMNEHSSRSHAVLTLHLYQRAKPRASVPADLRVLKSKLRLVDLAGSERMKDTGSTGDRFAEGVHINKGLLALGNVVSALTEGKKRKHIPYRDSKLTRLLQDSLGGGAETVMIACCSPADSNHSQTVNTLRYASRARKIKNNLRTNNKQTPEEEIAYLRGEVASRDSKIRLLVGTLQDNNIQIPAGFTS